MQQVQEQNNNSNATVISSKTKKKTASGGKKKKKSEQASVPVKEQTPVQESSAVEVPAPQPEPEPVPQQNSQSDETTSSDKETTPKSKSKSKGKSPKLKPPKRAATAYNFFSKEQHPLIKEENPDLSFGEKQSLISQKWKELSDEDKEPYQKQHLADKERYSKEKEEYDSAVESSGESPTTKKSSKSKNTGPKKATSAYGFFKQEVSKKLKESNPELTFGDLQKEVGKQWTSLKESKDSKQVTLYESYVKKNTDDKERYAKEMEEYEKTSSD